MRRRLREFLRQRFLIGAMRALAAIMVIATVNFTADAHAKPADATLSAITAVQVPIDAAHGVIAFTAAEDSLQVAVTEKAIQTTGAFVVPIQQRSAAVHAIAGIAGKEIDIRATIEQSIRHAALALAHFQPPALTAT